MIQAVAGETIELEEGLIGNGDRDPDATRDDTLELMITSLDNQM